MKIVIFDIDGVITDGTISVDTNGNLLKRVNMKDIDAIYELHRRRIPIGVVTAEKNNFTEWIKLKFPWDIFYDGISDKGQVLQEIRQNGYEYIVYLGDGKKDIVAFRYADFRICPQDAIDEIKVLADYVMKGNAGTGGLWDLLSLLNANMESDWQSSNSGWLETLEEHNRLVYKIIEDKKYQKAIEDSSILIYEALLKGRRVVIFGNGGSAADAQHIAADFIGRVNVDRRPLDVKALTANTSILTASDNDYFSEDIFSRQIEGMTTKGDVAIGISMSSMYANVRNALDRANEKQVKTILLTGQCVQDVDYDVTLSVCSNNIARIQEIHILTGHFWVAYVEKKLCEANKIKSVSSRKD